MLPPIDDSILKNNPAFASLHAALANKILNPNGSTQTQPAQQEREAVSSALKTARIHAAKRELMRTSLCSMELSLPSAASTTTKSRSSRSTQALTKTKSLPPELLELVILLSSRLSTQTMRAENVKLLESSELWQVLQNYAPTIGSLVSAHLHNHGLSLCRLLHPTTNPSYLHRSIPLLPSTLLSLSSSPALLTTSLLSSHTRLLTLSLILLSAYTSALTHSIHLLETTKHSSVYRHILSYSSYLSLASQSVALELKERFLRGERTVYTKEVERALGNYRHELRGGRERLKERRGEAERRLWGYGVGRKGEGGEEKERTMKEIARVYGEMMGEIEDVKRDIGRLRGK